MVKIIEKINEKIEKKETFIALEFFPPRTAEGVAHLYSRFDRMAKQGNIR